MPSSKNNEKSGFQPGKLFIGGLSFDTTDEKLRAFFKKYGVVSDAVVMRDPSTRRSRGFGFVTFADSAAADAAMAAHEHVIDGRRVEAKRAVPRDDSSRETSSASNSNHSSTPRQANVSGSRQTSSNATVPSSKKIFVGGLHYETCDETLKKYFRSFGKVESVQVMYNRETNKSRGFGFVTFDSEVAVNKVLQNRMHNIDNKSVEVKRAVPKADAPPARINHSSNFSSSTSSHSTGSNGSHVQRSGSASGNRHRGRRDDRGTSGSASNDRRKGANVGSRSSSNTAGNTRGGNVGASASTTRTTTAPKPRVNAWAVPLHSAWNRGGPSSSSSGNRNSNQQTKQTNRASTQQQSKRQVTTRASEKKEDVTGRGNSKINVERLERSEDARSSSPRSPILDVMPTPVAGVTSSRMAFAKSSESNKVVSSTSTASTTGSTSPTTGPVSVKSKSVVPNRDVSAIFGSSALSGSAAIGGDHLNPVGAPRKSVGWDVDYSGGNYKPPGYSATSTESKMPPNVNAPSAQMDKLYVSDNANPRFGAGQSRLGMHPPTSTGGTGGVPSGTGGRFGGSSFLGGGGYSMFGGAGRPQANSATTGASAGTLPPYGGGFGGRTPMPYTSGHQQNLGSVGGFGGGWGRPPQQQQHFGAVPSTGLSSNAKVPTSNGMPPYGSYGAPSNYAGFAGFGGGSSMFGSGGGGDAGGFRGRDFRSSNMMASGRNGANPTNSGSMPPTGAVPNLDMSNDPPSGWSARQ